MDTNDVAARHDFATLAAQHTLIGMRDRPEQFREDPMCALFRQAWREKYGHTYGRDLMSCPF
jgi:hypothetical protein